MLADSCVACRLPAQDLERAKAFYATALGLHPIEARPGGLRDRCGNCEFAFRESSGVRNVGSKTEHR